MFLQSKILLLPDWNFSMRYYLSLQLKGMQICQLSKLEVWKNESRWIYLIKYSLKLLKYLDLVDISKFQNQNYSTFGVISDWVTSSNLANNWGCILFTWFPKYLMGFLFVIRIFFTGRQTKHEYFRPTFPFSFIIADSYLKNSLRYESYASPRFWSSSKVCSIGRSNKILV